MGDAIFAILDSAAAWYTLATVAFFALSVWT